MLKSDPMYLYIFASHRKRYGRIHPLEGEKKKISLFFTYLVLIYSNKHELLMSIVISSKVRKYVC